MVQTKQLAGLQQPARYLYSDYIFPPFLLSFFVLCLLYPLKYFPFYALACMVAYTTARYIYVQYTWGELLHKMPHPPRRFWTGSLHLVTPDTLIHSLKGFYEQYGPMLGIAQLPGFPPMVSITSADAFRTIMSTHNVPKGLIMRYFERGNSLWDPIGSGWLGTGLLTSNGALWKARRNIITPTFHFHILTNYMSIFVNRTNIMVSKLKKLADGKSHDVFPHCTDLTLDIIGACAFGIDLECQTAEEPSHYVQAIHDITQLVFNRTFNPLKSNPILYAMTPEGWKWNKLIKTIHQLPDRLIRERRAYIHQHQEVTEKRRLDFLDMLLTVEDENGEHLSDMAIRNEVDTFLFEGHDTTAAGLVWSLYCLASNPECQRRAREEIMETLGDRNEPTYEEAKSGLPYLESCIKEAIRLYPPVPFIVRNNEEALNLDGYHVPKDTELVLCIYAMHRSPEYWKNPEAFDPERFQRDGIQHPFSYVPFSAGHRSCIGQLFAMLEEKTILTILLKNFEFVLDEKHPIDQETNIILRPRHGVKLYIKPLNE